MVEGGRFEIYCRRSSTGGSNPPLSAHLRLDEGRGDRVAEGARLEIVCGATHRGFESPSLRHLVCMILWSDEGRVPRLEIREPRQVREEATVAVPSGLGSARLSTLHSISSGARNPQ